MQPLSEPGTEGELSPLAQQRRQERTPKGNPSGVCYPPAALDKQLKVLLTPLSANEARKSTRRPLPQKRLLEEYSSGEESSDQEPRAKQIREDVTGAGETKQATDSDGSDSNDAPYLDDGSLQLSAYERKRLKNITENARFFASLKLLKSAARLHKMTTKKKSPAVKRAKPKPVADEPVRRRSMRLQRVDPSGVPLPEIPAQPEPSIEEHPRLPPGPLQMIATSENQSHELTREFLDTWTRISQIEVDKPQERACSLERYKAGLNDMVLHEEAVRKVVKNRIYSLAIHPSESRTLVAAGDKSGGIGLWDLDCPSEAGLCVFMPHSQPVSCMYFSPFHPAHLLSLSHDGTVRCGDVTRAVFEEVFRSEEYSFSSFDFLAADASTLLVGAWDGDVAVVDRRTPGTGCELSADMNSRTTRTVHVHPVNRQYFVAAGAGNVCVYDVRRLKRSGNKPVSSLLGHAKSVASAYFSPVTGSRVVTTCADDTLRIFDTSCLSSAAPVLATVRHNNNTGRWLTRFRAVWDPKQEDCFVVGSMARPRQIEVFQATGKRVHSFLNEDFLGSVCSINVMHPTKNVLAGGNSSGRLHVFTD